MKTLAQGHTASASAKAGLLVQECLSEPSSPTPRPADPGPVLGLTEELMRPGVGEALQKLLEGACRRGNTSRRAGRGGAKTPERGRAAS